jgi:hypothetical protein
MENALLYTFSTIAQTLGGAIALLSAFVLYRFQSLDSIFEKEAKVLRTDFAMRNGNVAEFDQLESVGDYQRILEIVKAQGERLLSIPAFKRLKHGIHQKAKITDAFMAAVSSTGAGMMLSIIVLPVTHIVVARPLACDFLLLVGVLIFGVCIWMYWLVVSVALGIRRFRGVNRAD